MSDENDTYSTGDVVTLKSGSPDMTVVVTEDQDDRTVVTCKYYNIESFDVEKFRSDMLTTTQENEGGG